MESNFNTDSILLSIKKLLGILEDDQAFDTDIIIHINSVFMILNQLGIGPIDGFKIESQEETWNQFIQDDKLLEDVKTYIYLRVRLIFDPPLNSSIQGSIERTISELEFRLNLKETKEDTQNE